MPDERPMISWEQAIDTVLSRTALLETEKVPLDEARNRILAEAVRADVDSPPFDRSAMDGYAVRSADCGPAGADLEIIEKIAAGSLPTLPIGPGQTARIFTGAPIPEGADAVQIQERTEAGESERMVRILEPVPPGENIRRQGEEVRAGQVVLEKGSPIGAAEIGMLAWTGNDQVPVARRPRVSILSTGDELVEPGILPAGAQIRNSNGPMLTALAAAAGGNPDYLGIAGDEPGPLRSLMARGLSADLFLVSGGVSVGQRDRVRPFLEEMGVAIEFHGVAIRPGKPALFGRRGETLVFGLPGNPVSCLVIFRCLVAPAIRKLQGHRQPSPLLVPATLGRPVRRHRKRLLFLQARLEPGPGGLVAEPVSTTGSADLQSVVRSNAMILIPAGADSLPAGAAVMVLPDESR